MPLSKIQDVENQVISNLGRKNMLINGDFQVWQRGTSGTVNSYTCDRWYGWGYQQAVTRQQAENATSNTGRFALRNAHNDATSNQFSAIAQTLETKDTAKARGKKLTFSIDVKKGSAFTGTLFLQIVTRTDSEASINAGTRQVLVSEDISSSLTTSLQRFSVTTSSAVAQNALTVGVNVYHGGTSGTDANNFFQVERAQLEIGEESTEFESLPFGETLSLCQRYAWKLGGFGSDQYFGAPWLYFDGNNVHNGPFFNPVQMRVQPSMTQVGSPVLKTNGGAQSGFSFSLQISGKEQCFSIQGSKSGHGLSNVPTNCLNSPTTSDYFIMDSEF